MLIRILPAYFDTLLEEVEAGNVEARQLINELKFLRDLCKKDRCIAEVLERVGTVASDLFPGKRFEKSSSEKLRMFVNFPWL